MRTRYLTLAGVFATVALIVTSASHASGLKVFVNCEDLRAQTLPAPWVASQHPRTCNLLGIPADEADLVILRRARWSGWGQTNAKATGRSLNTHPGMGGPASVATRIVLSRIRSGCTRRRYYKRARITTRYGSGVLRLPSGCTER
jgi:hypothetical protein